MTTTEAADRASMEKPLSPAQAKAAQRAAPMHPVVVRVVNAMLVAEYPVDDAYVSITLKLEDIVKRVVDELVATDVGTRETTDAIRAQLFKERAFDFEEYYRKVGWKVIFDRPAYCETYPARFIFKKRGSRD